MIRMILFTVLSLVVFAAKFASADFYDDCKNNCSTAHIQCVEAITFFDETGIKEAKEACTNEQKECVARCQTEDSSSNEEAAEQKRLKEAEEAEKKAQEQQETINGSIKIYKFGE